MEIFAQNPVAIIGAGFAGLTAANFLRQHNVPFVLFESGKKIAGLATSFKDEEGFSHDFGAHFITNRLAKAIGVEQQCETVKYYGESVWIDGKIYKYPFGLIKIPRMSASWAIGQAKSLFNWQKPSSSEDWFKKHYGSSLANEIALPLIEAWSGVPARELSPAVGDGLFGGNIFKTLYLKTVGKLTGRAVACGYNREKPETASVWHAYPIKGISTLCEKLAEDLGDLIKLESPVKTIFVENEKVVAVEVNGKRQEVSAVVSTAPVNILSKMVTGTASFKKIEDFQYRAMTFVNMRFKGRNLMPDTVVWFPKKEFPFFRLTEATISMPWLAPEGKTIITADIGCQKNDDIWKMDEAELIELCLNNLAALIPDAKQRFLGGNVLKTPFAYPVFLNEYEEERQNFGQQAQISNLLSIGRNGEFSHMFMEDVYWRTQKKIKHFIESRESYASRIYNN